MGQNVSARSEWRRSRPGDRSVTAQLQFCIVTQPGAPRLPDGLVAFVKRDCDTCVLISPVLVQIESSMTSSGSTLTTFTQDDRTFPADVHNKVDDTSLSVSWHHDIETVPTLVRVDNGAETGRIVGWKRSEWQDFTGLDGLGDELADWRPGCGSLSVDPNLATSLMVRFGSTSMTSRRIEIAKLEDEFEAMFERGWTDGLPVVPPTEARVMAMLDGTSRDPSEVVAIVPPDLVDCTVEKIAINAVMAGCKPEYLPVVIAAVEASCTDDFNMHGLLATTMPAGPMIVVNGPIRERIGMNWSHNALGQGNRANSTIGRALQLVVRNVGGGKPGEVDRATHGQPSKLGFCFAEDEAGSPWSPLSTDFGVDEGVDAVTVFAANSIGPLVDQLSREPMSLARSLAAGLTAMAHPKMVLSLDAMMVMGPEHARVFRDAGWAKDRIVAEIVQLTARPGSELVRGAGEIAEGLQPQFADADSIPKVGADGLRLVHAGSSAGMWTVLIGGWVNGLVGGSAPVCVPITG